MNSGQKGDYYGSKAFEDQDGNYKQRSDEDYARNYSITNHLSEELSKFDLTEIKSIRTLKTRPQVFLVKSWST